MEKPEFYLDIKQKAENGSFHASYQLGELMGTGYFGGGIDECGDMILSKINQEVTEDVSVEIRSVQDYQDIIEGLNSLSQEEVEILVMVLNEERDIFTEGKIKSLR